MSVLHTIGVIIGLLLIVVCGGVALFTFIANPSMSDSGQLGGTIALILAAGLGVFIVRRSSPAFLDSITGSPARFVRWLLQPSTFRRPLGMAVWTLAIGLVLLALAPRNGVRFLIALGAFMIYLIVAMISLATMPGWWRRALLTLLLGPVVMTGLMLTAEAFEKNVIGEGSLAFAGVLMWSWPIMLITGLGRLLFARPSPAPSPPPASELADRPDRMGHTSSGA